MKRFSVGCVLALALCGVTWANVIPTNIGITTAGSPYTWTYDLQLSNDQTVVSGTAPTQNPVPHTAEAGFFTLYDFFGYVGGSCAGPSGWTCTAQNVGFTPDDVSPPDDASIVNLTWAYTSGPDLSGQPSGIDLGHFTAESIYDVQTMVSYTSRGIKNYGYSGETITDNVGNTAGPATVPEPLSMSLIGLGLGCLALIRRRAK